MSLTSLLVAAIILVPAPSTKQEGWTGQIVMLKRSGVPYRFDKSGSDNDGSLMMIEYRVLKDRGDDLLLVENGKEVLVRRDDLVLQTEAVAYYSEVIQKSDADAT